MSVENTHSDANGDGNNVRVIQIDARAELRVQVSEVGVSSTTATAGGADDGGVNKNGSALVASGDCWFKLISGTAEMFGTELPVVCFREGDS
jgi:hypothetical protein